MRKIIKFFIDNYKLTWILTLITVLAGIAGFSLILRERTPTVDLGTVKINTFYYGATAEEIESEITKKIEDELRGIKGLKDVKSVSQSNQSMITIRIDIDNYDQDDVTDDIQTAVDRVTDLPANIDDLPEVIEINTEEFAVMKLAILGNNDNRQRDAFAEYLVDEIEDVNGVLEVVGTNYYKIGNHSYIKVGANTSLVKIEYGTHLKCIKYIDVMSRNPEQSILNKEIEDSQITSSKKFKESGFYKNTDLRDVSLSDFESSIRLFFPFDRYYKPMWYNSDNYNKTSISAPNNLGYSTTNIIKNDI